MDYYQFTLVAEFRSELTCHFIQAGADIQLQLRSLKIFLKYIFFFD